IEVEGDNGVKRKTSIINVNPHNPEHDSFDVKLPEGVYRFRKEVDEKGNIFYRYFKIPSANDNNPSWGMVSGFHLGTENKPRSWVEFSKALFLVPSPQEDNSGNLKLPLPFFYYLAFYKS
ncbi:MAG: hypothetical protein ACK4YF_05145, partial [Exilispira sp.]